MLAVMFCPKADSATLAPSVKAMPAFPSNAPFSQRAMRFLGLTVHVPPRSLERLRAKHFMRLTASLKVVGAKIRIFQAGNAPLGIAAHAGLLM